MNPALQWPLASFIALVLALELVVVLARIGRDATPFALVLVPTVAALVVAGAAEGWHGIRRPLVVLASAGRSRAREPTQEAIKPIGA